MILLYLVFLKNLKIQPFPDKLLKMKFLIPAKFL